MVGHDRGKVLTQVMLMLVERGEFCADNEYLRSQPDLLGSVPSDMAPVAGHSRNSCPGAVPLGGHGGHRGGILYIDPSLMESTRRRRSGLFSLTVQRAVRVPPSDVLLCGRHRGPARRSVRPGEAETEETWPTPISVLDDAYGHLRSGIAVGHRSGDDGPAGVGQGVRLRVDLAGRSTHFAAACRNCNVQCSNPQIHAGISRVLADPGRWLPALMQAGDSDMKDDARLISLMTA